mgnify:CR=1 FL=1
MVIGWKGGGLDDEYILSTHIFLNFDKDLHIGKATDLRFDERHFKMITDGLRERRIRIAGNEFDMECHGMIFSGSAGKPFQAYRF